MIAGERVELPKGTVEHLIVQVKDRLNNVTDLAALTPRYDIKRQGSPTYLYTELPATVIGTTLYCLVDTTPEVYTNGTYEIYTYFDNLPEIPRLGPFEFEVNGSTMPVAEPPGSPSSGSIPTTWEIDSDGSLNLIGDNGVIRVSLTADGRLNLYRADATIGAQIRSDGMVRVFDVGGNPIGTMYNERVITGAFVADPTTGFTFNDTQIVSNASRIIGGPDDPSVDVGANANMGSLFLRYSGELWLKTGPADTDWTRMATV